MWRNCRRVLIGFSPTSERGEVAERDDHQMTGESVLQNGSPFFTAVTIRRRFVMAQPPTRAGSLSQRGITRFFVRRGLGENHI